MEKREKIIEDRTYQLLIPPVRKAMPLCNRTVVLAGPALATLGKSLNKGGMDKFAALLGCVDPQKLDSLIMDAVTICKLGCNGNPISTEFDFERHFTDHRGEVYQVTIWALWECVKDFFPGAETFTQMLKTDLGKAL